ncbi:MAG: ribonuclease III [Cytophagia bacterium]|nr:MAG: ribonuclease III [Cytophagia bacterium]TAG39170.1 MAG: ribonuclease III [Cytophagia bacterium]
MLGLKKKVVSFLKLFKKLSEEDKKIIQAIRKIVGSPPQNLEVYKLALKHTSALALNHINGQKESNERLEYLGDAFLGAVVAEYLFRKYPFEDEGFLTEIRSRIVNRESLNRLAQKIGLTEIISYTLNPSNRHINIANRSMSGDALEAFVGAVYLDKGFIFCKKFIIKKLLNPHYDLEEVIANNKNFKSVVIEWAQKEGKSLRFEIIKESGTKHLKEFTAQLFINDEPFTIGHGLNKKKAEQAAAQKACDSLNIS